MKTNSQFADMPNPATFSAVYSSLFPRGVAAAELRPSPREQPWTLDNLLYPEERAIVSKAVPKRLQEFAAGRLCARRALADHGVTGFPVRARPDRAPIWPDSVVGSITHTAGFCAAVVARRDRMSGLGIDTEVAGDVDPELWPRICVEAETAWLKTLPADARAAASTLVFAAKEAYYKCQYPLTGVRLDFHDVRVVPVDPLFSPRTGTEGALVAGLSRPLSSLDRPLSELQGRFRFHDQYVSVGFGVPSGACNVSTPCRPETPSRPS